MKNFISHYIRSYLTLLLFMCATITFAHDIAVANSDGKTIYYDYNSDGSSVSVTYKGTYSSSYSNEYTGVIVIPETVTYNSKTYSVTSIGSSAFSGCSGLTSVTIPNSVTTIGSHAFYGCRGLTSVTIPNSVTSIDNYTFEGCRGLTSVTIPNSVTSIGGSAFYNTRIESLTIGTGIQTIASDAFSYSSINGAANGTKPVKVIWLANTPPSGYNKNVGGKVNYVPNGSYSGLSNTKIYPFLSSVFEVDGIKYVPVSPSERTCDAIDYVYNESAENIKIGNTVTYKNVTMTVKNVGNYICSSNTYIKTLEYNFDGPIGSSEFEGCSRLKSITWNAKSCSDFSEDSSSPFYYIRTQITEFIIGDVVTNIPAYLCDGMRNLKSITIPNSVTSIGSYAFEGCSGLTSMTIPNSVTNIRSSAFDGCSGLKSITWNAKNYPDFYNVASSPFYDIRTQITEFVIGDDVTSIPTYMCYDNSPLKTQ